MDERIERFIERMGMHAEEEGFTRIGGRIFGYLMLQPAECSLDDMAEALGVSKASISTDARRLEQFGLIERTTRPGDRKDYYSIADDAFARSLERSIERLRRFHHLMQHARHLPVRSAEVRARLDYMDEAYEVTIDSMTEALSKWGRARSTTAARRR